VSVPVVVHDQRPESAGEFSGYGHIRHDAPLLAQTECEPYFVESVVSSLPARIGCGRDWD
jgi:hypothetical protein